MFSKFRKKINNNWLFILIFIFVPLVFIFTFFHIFDNDLWYLLSEGRYILKHGIYYVDVLSMHQGLDIVVQNWLSGVVFWLLYSIIGWYGLFFLVIILNYAICYLIYKIAMLISDDNKIISLIISLVTDVCLLKHLFVTTRPQLFSFVIILVLIYLLELYIKNKNNKYILFIPLLSLLEINLHAAFWFYLFLIMIPYIIDSFKCKKLSLQGYNTKPLIIIFIISFLVGFINPYGYKSVFFIFNSYGNQEMVKTIYELFPLTFGNEYSFIVFGIIMLTNFLYLIFRKGKYRIRYFLLFYGTLFIGLNSIRALSYFFIVSLFPIALLLKDVVPDSLNKINVKKRYIVQCILILFVIVLIGYFSFIFSKEYKYLKLNYYNKEAVDVMDKVIDNDKEYNAYVSFEAGGYLEFRGYKSYIDSRAEVFIKETNHKKNILKEYNRFESGWVTPKKFAKKYNFDFIFAKHGERFAWEDSLDGYVLIYNKNSCKVFVREDLISSSFKKNGKEKNEIILN